MNTEKAERMESTWYQVRYLDRGGNDRPGQAIDFANAEDAGAFFRSSKKPCRMVRIFRHEDILELSRSSKKD
jgi:hypothetical protein